MQTSVVDRLDQVAKAGSLAIPVHQCEIITVIATGEIRPGHWVGKDSADAVGAGGHPDAAAEVSTTGYGIAIYDSSKPATDGDHLYEAGDAVPVLRKGQIYVDSEDGLTFGDQPFVRHVAAGAEVLGQFRSDADGTDGTAAPTVRAEETTSAAGLVKLSINLA